MKSWGRALHIYPVTRPAMQEKGGVLVRPHTHTVLPGESDLFRQTQYRIVHTHTYTHTHTHTQSHAHVQAHTETSPWTH